MAKSNVKTIAPLRQRIIDGAKPKSKIIMFFGEEIELRQPTTGRVLELRRLDADNPGQAAAQMIIQYCFEPGTKNLVFEDTDIDIILSMPFGEDMSRMNHAIAGLTDINVEDAEKN